MKDVWPITSILSTAIVCSLTPFSSTRTASTATFRKEQDETPKTDWWVFLLRSKPTAERDEMTTRGNKIADKPVRYLGVTIYTLLVCFAGYWLIVSCWWCGLAHPRNIVLMFCGCLWCTFVQLWYVAIPMTAVVVLDVQRRLRERRNGTPNQTSDATSEPAPAADSSSHQG